MTYNELWHMLVPLYDKREAKSIVQLLLERGFNLSLADVLCGKITKLSPAERANLLDFMAMLQTGMPVQYVLGEETFLGNVFKVNSSVLIPRPETEELCGMVIDTPQWQQKTPGYRLRVLDIGTGSGCIAITLKLKLPHVRVEAWDVSPEALKVARSNAGKLHADVVFRRRDALCPPRHHHLWNCIVSNPPYISEKEKAQMETNVLDHEPHTALFVPDNRPLLFYEHIAQYATTALQPGGMLFLEINPIYCHALTEMLHAKGFAQISTLNDSYGKQRFVKAQWNEKRTH